MELIGLLFLIILYALILGVSIFVIVLYIKLSRRGIKALDIYINKNNKDL